MALQPPESRLPHTLSRLCSGPLPPYQHHVSLVLWCHTRAIHECSSNDCGNICPESFPPLSQRMPARLARRSHSLTVRDYSPFSCLVMGCFVASCYSVLSGECSAFLTPFCRVRQAHNQCLGPQSVFVRTKNKEHRFSNVLIAFGLASPRVWRPYCVDY